MILPRGRPHRRPTVARRRRTLRLHAEAEADYGHLPVRHTRDVCVKPVKSIVELVSFSKRFIMLVSSHPTLSVSTHLRRSQIFTDDIHD